MIIETKIRRSNQDINMVAQITFNDDISNIVASMLEEKSEVVQTYFANFDFQHFVNTRVFQAAVSRLSPHE